MPPDCVYKLTSRDQQGYVVDRTWLKDHEGAGIVCSHCENLLESKQDLVTRIVVDNTKPVEANFSTVSRLGGVRVLSDVLIDVIGEGRLRKLGRLLPVVSRVGFTYTTHHALVGKSSPGLPRGSKPQNPGLCRQCDRLLYWPGSRPEKWYLLREYWENDSPIMLIDGYLFCSANFYGEVIEPARIPKLSASKIALTDVPIDGFPADFGALIKQLRLCGEKK